MPVPILLLVALIAAASPVSAQQRDSAALVVRLGTDTVSIERYVRTADSVVMEAVHRVPATMRHRLVTRFGAQGRVTGGEWVASTPSGQTVTRRTITYAGDSAIVTTVQGTARREVRLAGSGAPLLAGPFYAPYEMLIMRAVARSGDRAELPLLAGTAFTRIPVVRVGRDSVALRNQFGEAMRAHIDARGRLLHLHTPALTTVERLSWIDLEAMAREFAARDARGGALGQLSPRLASRTSIGPANVWIDYGRPAMRGRPVWGALVPWGEVWRLGANQATHLATDRPLRIGDVALAPGTYTLFLVARPESWTLVVNRGTGMSGLERDSTLDVGRVPMTVDRLERPVEQFTIEVSPSGPGGSGTLSVAWDRLRGSVPVVVER